MDKLIDVVQAIAYTIVTIYFLLEIYLIAQHIACN